MKIKQNEVIVIAFITASVLIIGAIMVAKGTANLMAAMDADFALQAANGSFYDPNVYASTETMHAILKARGFLLIGASLCGLAFSPVGIYFTCKWIRSLIPTKGE